MSATQTYPLATPDWEVPSFTEQAFFSRRTTYCICIPVLNEGARIQRQLNRMRALVDIADIIIADGGSTDGALASEFLQEMGVRTLLTKTGPGKLSAQMRMAMAYALEQGYDGMVFIDGNDKDDPNAIPLFIEALREGYDHVQGSRFVPGGREVNTPAARLWGIKLIHAPLISAAAGFRYSDTTNGFRAYSARLLRDERVKPFREVFSQYELHYYLAIRAARLKLRIKEVPVIREYPATGKTPTKISPFKGNLKILRTLFEACVHAYNP